MAVGCPCDISAMYPTGGVEEGDFNVTLTITGLDTGRPKAEGLACLFNDKVQVPAQIVSTDTVLCTAPSLAHLAAVASASQSGQATTAQSSSPSDVQRVAVDVVGAAFRISRSTNRAKWLQYFTRPTFEFPPLPGAFITGDMPSSQRTITIRGQHFNGNVGGMHLRLNTSALDLLPATARLTVLDSNLAVAVLPPIAAAGAFRFELSVNSDTWYPSGEIEFVNALDILALTPSSGPVLGGYTVTVTHSRAPFPVSMGTWEAKVGQFHVVLTRLSATQMMMHMPGHTAPEDPSWHIPGNVSVEIYSVSLPDPYTDTKSRFQISRRADSSAAGGSVFSYICSTDEIESKNCCPAGTAGPGGNNGSFCFACQSGKFAPLVASMTCFACPANAVSGNRSATCACRPGFEYQLISDPAQECVACAPGTYRNDSMTACGECSWDSKPSASRDACIPRFVGCDSRGPNGSTAHYQPRNDTEHCCLFGHVLPGQAFQFERSDLNLDGVVSLEE